MINGFITAIRTLTVFPLPGKESKDFSDSLPWFPVVGSLLALLIISFTFCCQKFCGNISNEILAFFILFFEIILTRALHLDGLADWADSLGASGNKEKMLLIMKDSANGTFGVTAIYLLLFAKWIVFKMLLENNMFFAGIFSALVISRFIMVYLAVTLPYAREEGTGKPFINGAKKQHFFFALIITSFLLSLTGKFIALFLFVEGILIAFIWRGWCKKHLDGITGDLLGAGSEFVEIIILFSVLLIL